MIGANEARREPAKDFANCCGCAQATKLEQIVKYGRNATLVVANRVAYTDKLLATPTALSRVTRFWPSSGHFNLPSLWHVEAWCEPSRACLLAQARSCSAPIGYRVVVELALARATFRRDSAS